MALTKIDDRGLNTPIDLLDNEKIRFGTGNDLEIYHDGSNSFIKNNTGWLRTLAGYWSVKNLADDEYQITAEVNGAVSLYYDNSKKFETTSDGWRTQDTIKGCFGDSDDLQIYHNGSHSRIDHVGTGNLYINVTSTETAISCNANGSIDLHYDNSKKFETTSAGWKSGDNVKGTFGASEDLQIFHDGTNNEIMSANGAVHFYTGANIEFRKGNSSSNEDILKAIPNGAVELFYDDSKKLETTSYGAAITDRLNVSNLQIPDYNSGTDLGQIRFGTGNDLKIYHNGSNSIIKDTGTGDLVLETTRLTIQDANNNALMGRFTQDAGVELCFDGTTKLETRAGDVWIKDDLVIQDNDKIRIGTGYDLDIYHSGGVNYIESPTDKTIAIRPKTGEEGIKVIADSAVELYHNNVKIFETLADGVDITGWCRPTTDDYWDIGHPSYRWDDIRATNSSINTSDRNEKEDITSTDLGLSFVNKLTPVSYKRKGKTRTHYGLVAQDVETVITDLGKTTTQFAPLIKDKLEDGTE